MEGGGGICPPIFQKFTFFKYRNVGCLIIDNFSWKLIIMAPFSIKGGILESVGEKNNGRRALFSTFLAKIRKN